MSARLVIDLGECRIGLAKVFEDARSIWCPPPTLTVSEWADRERFLSSESSAEPGRWHTSRIPYMREIMDALNEPGIQRIIVIKASQVGYTETLNNVLGYYMANDPAPALIIQPTLEMAETWSKDRLSPMLRDTPVLVGMVHDPKSRDSANTIRQKVFPGGRLTIIDAPMRPLVCRHDRSELCSLTKLIAGLYRLGLKAIR